MGKIIYLHCTFVSFHYYFKQRLEACFSPGMYRCTYKYIHVFITCRGIPSLHGYHANILLKWQNYAYIRHSVGVLIYVCRIKFNLKWINVTRASWLSWHKQWIANVLCHRLSITATVLSYFSCILSGNWRDTVTALSLRQQLDIFGKKSPGDNQVWNTSSIMYTTISISIMMLTLTHTHTHTHTLAHTHTHTHLHAHKRCTKHN